MKRNKLILACICSFFNLFGLNMYSQISTDELPISFNLKENELKEAKTLSSTKILPSIDIEKIYQEDLEDDKNGIPPRFGYPHKVEFNLDNSGKWFTLPNGDRIWQLELSCPGALSINLLYDRFWLPEGAKFFAYSNDKKHTLGAFTAMNNKEGDNAKDIQGFATGLIYGDKVTLEYYLPKDVKEQGTISIAYIVQGYRYINLPEIVQESGFGSSGSCQVNINCSEGNNWQNEKNAVALILVNGNRYCTGSLINTTVNDSRPLFLTADHCLGGWANSDIKYDAITNPNLPHYSFYWNYESPNCSNINGTVKSTTGAKIVANKDLNYTDFALLELTEDPRNKSGVNLYYLGWDRSGNAGTGGVGIHHPSGDVKKIATHNITPSSSGNYWRLNWMRTTNGYSVTEGGSSGSSLLNNQRRIIGQLYGGSNVNCSDPANDYALYGKFSISWNNDSDSRRRLKDWLDPINSGVSVLDGKKYINCASLPTSFTNQTVTTTKTVDGNNLYMKNIIINTGKKLTVNSCNEVTIDPNFEVQNGAELEIFINP